MAKKKAEPSRAAEAEVSLATIDVDLAAEELRRQAAQAVDTRLPSEVGTKQDSFLSNVMMLSKSASPFGIADIQTGGGIIASTVAVAHAELVADAGPPSAANGTLARAFAGQHPFEGDDEPAKGSLRPLDPKESPAVAIAALTPIDNEPTGSVPPAAAIETVSFNRSASAPMDAPTDTGGDQPAADPLPNSPPIVSVLVGEQAATEDAPFSFTLPAGTFSDVDAGDTLTLVATLADGSPLPAWLSFNPSTGTFSGVPENDDVGAISIKVTATDSAGAAVSEVFGLSVANTNDAPVVSIVLGAQIATEDAPFSFTLPAGTFSDVDVGDTLTFAATLADGSPLPAWLSFNPATGTFSGTPDNGDVGAVNVKITATDSAGASATQTIGLAVANVDGAPVITSGTAVSVAENTSGTVYTAAAVDADAGTTLTYSLTGADAALFNIDANTGAVSFKSSPNFEAPSDAGGNNVYDVVVRASDGTNTTSQAVAITVTNANEGPVVTSSTSASVAENTTGTVYTATATDPDAGTTLTYSLTGADAALFNIDANTGAVSFKSSPNFEAPSDAGGNNVYDVVVRASDGTNTTSQAVAITVTNTNEGPVVTSAPTASVAENTTGTVYTATATDPDAGTTLTYSLTGADATLFNIDPNTGAVSFKSAPDFEAPSDAGGNNVYDVVVRASDGTNTTSQAVAITVMNTNEGPVVTSAPAASVAENTTGTVYTATATDPDAGTTLTYSLTGADAALFNIDANTGAVSFKSSPNFEAPSDAGGNNVYDVVVRASDGTNTTSQAVAITVTNTNEGPVVTSATTASVAENTTGTVYTATATDPDAGTTLTYSLTGADAALFNIDANTGAVSFKSAPDFEAPADAGGNNVYDVVVRASDGTNTTSQAVAITVTNTNEGPVVTSAPTASVAENTTGTIYTATATDPDAGTTLTYSLTGADAALFNIDANTGAVSFKSAPNFEAPADAGGNNVYDVVVRASDGTNTTSQAVAITVTNTNEGPVVTSAPTASVAENTTGTVYTATATDPDAGTTLTYSLTGADAALFNVDANTGAVSFKSAPDFEAPADAGGNNVYDVVVRASDGTNTTSQAVAITVMNTNEGPVVTSAPAASVAENTTGTVYTATATDPDAGTTLTYSLTGADAALFNIDANTGAVSFKSSPNFEAPSDAGGNNVYDVVVRASDGTNTTSQAVAITVTNTNEGPVVTSATTASVAENTTGTVYTATATDPDAGTTLTYSLTGADAALFNIDANTGAVSFKSAPDFEAPADAGGNNVYDVVVRASDGTNTTSQAVAITVTNTNEGPVVTSAPTASVAENTTGTIYTATATDPDAGTTLTYSLTGADAALFNIDANTGAVSFKSAPNFEAPADAGGNNVYDVVVRASDGTNTTSQAVAITVTNTNEGPVVTSAPTASVAENTTGTVYTATATDPDAGTTLTYSLTGADAALFNVDANTGAVSFKSAPNFEAPADAGGNNVYDVVVRASDGTNTTSQAVAITVTNTNEGPVVTSASTASVAENTTGTVYTATATDPDAGTTITYSLTGADAALFNVDANTGAVSFKSAPDFEAPADAGGNNVYDVVVRASDGTNTTSQAVAITVTNTNEGPVVTSSTSASVAENTTGTVYTATATDPDAGTTLTYSLTGADAALFNIDANTGAVSFKSSPNFEAPADAGGNNVYDVVVRASDGTNTTSQAVAITVTNTNEGPVVTSAPTASVAENTTGTVYTATATDPDAGTTLTYSLTGADAALFNIDANTGAVSFKSAPNFEAPADAGGNNVYDVVVRASDGTNTTSQAVAITVGNVNEAPTAIVGSGVAVTTVVSTAEFESGAAASTWVGVAGPTFDGWSLVSGDPIFESVGSSFNGTNNAGHGTAIDLAGSPSNVAIQRSFAGLDPNQDYVLTFRASSGSASANVDNGIGVTINGASTTIGAADLVSTYQTYTVRFTTDATGQATIRIEGLDPTPDNTGAYLDTVTVARIDASTLATVAENAATGTVVGTVTGVDPDQNDQLTYTLTDNAGGRFAINSATGVITVADGTKLDFENATAHTVGIRVTDSGGLTVDRSVVIAVGNVNEGPVVTSAATASVAENTTGTVYTATATDPDAGTTLTYSLTGADAALFNIDPNTGAVSFKSSPNFEAPSDAGGNNVYDVVVRASDGTNITSKAVAITVTNTNEGPVVTSAPTASVAENTTGTVYTATATDPDAGTTLTYSLTGADAALFNIDANTGAVSFKSSPNFEAPADAGGNNVYDVVVRASDGTNTTSQAVAITVTNTNEGPVVTSAPTANVAENTTGTVYTATATDPDAGTTLTYSLTGADAALFNIDANTGAVSFKSAPNFEAPADAGGNNVYDVVVRASDGTNTTSQAVAITVMNTNEGPVVTSAPAASVAENTTGTVYTATATDPDAGTTLTYSLTGADAALFNIDANTGAVSFKSSPNFEAPSDAGGNNVYDVVVRASDGTNTTSQAVAITVTNTNEGPVVTSATTASVAENTTGTVYTATATDPDAGTTLTYSLTGADAALFNIDANTGAVSFKSAPDFEAPADAGGNNVYDVVVRASDGTNTTSQAVAITVTNTNEGPVVTSAPTASVAENTTGTIYTATATDPDAGTTLTYSLTGADAALFNIDANTGAVSFKSAPNFEAPADAGGNNVYDVVVRASDGTNTTSQAVAITVTNTNEGPVVTSAPTASVAENTTGTVYTATATDPDAGTTLTYSLTGADAALFNVDANTGAVSFKSAPNFEAPADAGGNNVYDVVVRASDGTNTTSQAVAITVTDVHEVANTLPGATLGVPENTGTPIFQASGPTPASGARIFYSVSGTDAGLFSIDSQTGALKFTAAPDYEKPADAGTDNVHNVVVTAAEVSGPNLLINGSFEADQIASGSWTPASALTGWTATNAGGIELWDRLNGIQATDGNQHVEMDSANARDGFYQDVTTQAGQQYVIGLDSMMRPGTTAASDRFEVVWNGTVVATIEPGTAWSETSFIVTGTGSADRLMLRETQSGSEDSLGGLVDNIRMFAITDATKLTTQTVDITVTNVNEAPVITSVAASSVAENTAGIVYTATATDPDAGTTLTYSLTGTDAARFNIDANTGAVAFKSAPNFEAPADAGGNNVYDVVVRASDGTNTTSQAVAISVTNTNEGPVVTSAATASVSENTSGTVYTATATDPDAGTTLTYSLTGADAAQFNIDANTGAVSFKSAPDFEAPSDAGGNNVYDVVVRASDGTNTTSQAVAITVTNANEAPVIASDAKLEVAENTSGPIYTASATDPDAGTTLTYSLTGADAGLFTIDSSTGAVSFRSAPDFEHPSDGRPAGVPEAVAAFTGLMNTAYSALNDVVSADQIGGVMSAVVAFEQKLLEAATAGSDAKVVFELVANAEAEMQAATKVDLSSALKTIFAGFDADTLPALHQFSTNDTGASALKLQVDYDAKTADMVASNSDPAQVSEMIAKIDAVIGDQVEQAFASGKFEGFAGGDPGSIGDNRYDVVVEASDGVNTSQQALYVFVQDTDEAPGFTSNEQVSVAENTKGPVYTAAAVDPEGAPVTYSLAGSDANLFTIDSKTGEVSFKATPDFETPLDQPNDAVHSAVTAITGLMNVAYGTLSDALGTEQLPSALNAILTFEQKVVEIALSGGDPATMTELVANAQDAIQSTTKTDLSAAFKTIFGSFDADTITSLHTFATNSDGAAALRQQADYDSKTTEMVAGNADPQAIADVMTKIDSIIGDQVQAAFDSGKFDGYDPKASAGDNVYAIDVIASDGTNTSSQAVAITVTNVNEGPSFTSAASASVAENTAGTVYTATATDPDAGTTLTYSLTGSDAALFNVDANTGAVSFKSAPNFEAPKDTGANNVYDVVVQASDGTNTTAQAVAITVTNVNEAPVITSAAAASVAENSAGTVYTATATDQDAGTKISYSLAGTDAALFNIDAVTGAVSFKSAPNFEAPADAGGNNVYDVVVSASDGSKTNVTSQAVAITVTNVNEGPVITSAATATVAENTSGTVYTAAATDPDAGSKLSYSLTGSDATLFNIDATTGAVLFKATPNYEAPTDSGANNVYDVVVRASDGTNTTTQALAITVTDKAEALTLTSGNDVFTDTGVTETSIDGGAGNDTITGSSGADMLIGGDGNDSLVGGSGDDTLNGGAGVDTILGGAGNDVIYDGTGADLLDGGDGSDTYNLYDTVITGSNTITDSGTSGVDTVVLDNSGQTNTFELQSNFSYATSGIEVIDGTKAVNEYLITNDPVANFDFTGIKLTGVDGILGGSGNDTITGSAGADNIDGSGGNDLIAGGAGNDTLTGGDGDDSLIGSTGTDSLNGGNGNDTLIGGSEADTLTGGAGTDTADYSGSLSGVTVDLSLTTAQKSLGDASGDVLSGIERAVGSAFADTLFGTSSSTIEGGGGNDNLNAIGGSNGVTMLGGDGDDNFYANGAANITMSGGAGSDNFNGNLSNTTVDYSTSGAAVSVNLATNVNSGGDAAGDSLKHINNLVGSAFADTLTGDASNNILMGGAGNDTLSGGAGNDTLAGGAGIDTADYSGSLTGVTVDLSLSTAQTSSGDASGDVLSGIERVVGSANADTIYGNTGSTIEGGSGNDNLYAAGGHNTVTMSGGDGNDNLYANGAGNVTMSGGAGSDNFYGNSSNTTVDYSASGAGVSVNLATNIHSGGDAAGDKLYSVNHVTGSAFADTLTGDGGNNILMGGAGNDSLIGGAGDDTFYGGLGNDQLSGGSGADLFVMQAGHGNDIVAGGAGGGWIDAIDLRDSSGNSYSGNAVPSDWTIALTSGSILSTGTESLNLSSDAAGTITHTDGTTTSFSEIEQIRW